MRGRGIQPGGDFLQRKAVTRAKRYHDAVVQRRRLRFDIELSANTLSQRQAPGAIEA